MSQKYNKVSAEMLDELKKVLGEAYVFTDEATLDRYKTDEEMDPRFFRLPEVVCLPANAEEVAEVVKL